MARNIFYYKGWKYNKKYGHITIRDKNIKCKDEYEFESIIEIWLKSNNMNLEERNKYRSSPQWKKLAIKIRKRAGYRCELCGIYKRKGLNIHHTKEADSYGKENIDDLVCLCSACHKHIITWILSRTKNKLDIPKFCSNLKQILKKSNY